MVKDPNSGAILNIDNEKLKAYKKQKQHFLNNTEKIKKVEDDIQEIKKLLEQLIRDRN